MCYALAVSSAGEVSCARVGRCLHMMTNQPMMTTWQQLSSIPPMTMTMTMMMMMAINSHRPHRNARTAAPLDRTASIDGLWASHW